MKINLGPGALLFLVFFVLKVCGKLDWSWFWVWSPIWIPFAIFCGLLVLLFFVKLFER